MVPGDEEHPILAVRRKRSLNGAPFRFCTIIVAALDGIAYRDNERGTVDVRFAPSLLVDSRNGLSGSIAQDGKPKIPGLVIISTG